MMIFNALKKGKFVPINILKMITNKPDSRYRTECHIDFHLTMVWRLTMKSIVTKKFNRLKKVD